MAAYRYVASDLATDVVVNVGDVKFYLHKVKFKISRPINQQTHLLVLVFVIENSFLFCPKAHVFKN